MQGYKNLIHQHQTVINNKLIARLENLTELKITLKFVSKKLWHPIRKISNKEGYKLWKRLMKIQSFCLKSIPWERELDNWRTLLNKKISKLVDYFEDKILFLLLISMKKKFPLLRQRANSSLRQDLDKDRLSMKEVHLSQVLNGTKGSKLNMTQGGKRVLIRWWKRRM